MDNRRPGTRRLESIRLREYATHETALERVTAFLQDVDGATRADISGATGEAWATVHNALNVLLADGHLDTEKTATPWVYRWKE